MCLGYLNCCVLWFSKLASLRLGGRTVLWVEHPSKAAPPYLQTGPLLSPVSLTGNSGQREGHHGQAHPTALGQRSLKPQEEHAGVGMGVPWGVLKETDSVQEMYLGGQHCESPSLSASAPGASLATSQPCPQRWAALVLYHSLLSWVRFPV